MIRYSAHFEQQLWLLDDAQRIERMRLSDITTRNRFHPGDIVGHSFVKYGTRQEFGLVIAVTSGKLFTAAYVNSENVTHVYVLWSMD